MHWKFLGSAGYVGGNRVVTEAQAIARIRLRLKKDGESLRSCRDGSRWFSDLGAWYIVGPDNFIVASHCTIRSLVDQLQVLGLREVLAEDVL